MKEISNRQLTLLRKLNRKKYREQEQQFLIEGSRAVEQVIHNGEAAVCGLFFDESQRYWEQEYWMQVCKEFPSVIMSEGHFKEVSDTDNPQGVLALCNMPKEAEIGELAAQSGIILATDRIQDPGNLGTMIRTAAWFGVKGLLSGKGTVDLFHPKVVRSTAGATGSLSYRNTELAGVLPEFEDAGWEVFILEGGESSQDIRQVDSSGKTILLVGNEANGVAPDLFTGLRKRVGIPFLSDREYVESLNAAIATGIALFALSR